MCRTERPSTHNVKAFGWQQLTQHVPQNLRVDQIRFQQHGQHVVVDLCVHTFEVRNEHTNITTSPHNSPTTLAWVITLTCFGSSLSKIHWMQRSTFTITFTSLWFFSNIIFNLGSTRLRMLASSRCWCSATTATSAAAWTCTWLLSKAPYMRGVRSVCRSAGRDFSSRTCRFSISVTLAWTLRGDVNNGLRACVEGKRCAW